VTARMSLVIPQGSTLRRRFDLKNPDGTPMDLTGYSARMQYRSAHNATSVLLDASVANSRVTMGGSGGWFEVVVPASVTQALMAPARGVYDVEITSAGGEVYRILEGDVRVSPEVTR
jgi:hypothetical protein